MSYVPELFGNPKNFSPKVLFMGKLAGYNRLVVLA